MTIDQAARPEVGDTIKIPLARNANQHYPARIASVNGYRTGNFWVVKDHQGIMRMIRFEDGDWKFITSLV